MPGNNGMAEFLGIWNPFKFPMALLSLKQYYNFKGNKIEYFILEHKLRCANENVNFSFYRLLQMEVVCKIAIFENGFNVFVLRPIV